MEKTKYEQLAAIDVSAHIEKKQNLSYLSWAWAVDQLLRADPQATWSYNEPTVFKNGSMMVSCTVVAFGKAMTMQLPVMDYRNKAIPEPDAFAVNTAMMRCLVKGIALHGLGLYIYAGEDLPLEDDDKVKPVRHKPTDSGYVPNEEEAKFLQGIVDTIIGLDVDFEAQAAYLHTQKLDNEEKVYVWSLLPSNIRSGIKKTQSK